MYVSLASNQNIQYISLLRRGFTSDYGQEDLIIEDIYVHVPLQKKHWFLYMAIMRENKILAAMWKPFTNHTEYILLLNYPLNHIKFYVKY